MFSIFPMSYTFTVIFGATILGLLAGLMGTFAFVRGENLVGDAISHSALPGIALAFMLFPSRNIFILTIGAAASGLCAMGIILLITRLSKLKMDTALAMILSVFFGTGMVFMGIIQKHFGAEQAGIESFIFGQAAAFMRSDLLVVLGAMVAIFLLVVIFFKEFQLISFDFGFAESLGLPVGKLELLLNAMLIVVIVIGLQTVGVVLMSALLIGPSAASRLLTNNFVKMIGFSSLIGALSGGLGAFLSIEFLLPTGPTIVLVLMVLVILTLTFAPKTGYISKKWEQKAMAKFVRKESIIRHILELQDGEGWTSLELLQEHRKFTHWPAGELDNRLGELVSEKRIEESAGRYRLLGKGEIE
ncbi:metal ABC transporter permease [Peptoniphilus sp. KCTC 25270]|uniref:metal ABC transporter permease n=1 Tax=Peptoniphilus sp. KCTC 25270 TaxID=2897414 RepID=UPI001E649B5A|nr:iron chelate uptake ABC transporter family permease subunit [Peptoniphilus sp. KCTC 25270]MCD1146500.1 metal ABC transporter permease [Peptoniphilus sp. KCTC 25270]